MIAIGVPVMLTKKLSFGRQKRLSKAGSRVSREAHGPIRCSATAAASHIAAAKYS